MVKVNNLTCLSTISSARISLMVHPPPIKNEIFLPTIRKQGEMRVPWGGSAPSECCRPDESFLLVRFSAPPIHQSPCCWAFSLLRFAGLSPNVGWQMKAVPLLSHPPIPSSKSKLQASGKKKQKMFIPRNTLWLSFDIINSTLQFYNHLFCSMCQWNPMDTCNEILYQCIQLDKYCCCNRDCCCKYSVGHKMDCVF